MQRGNRRAGQLVPLMEWIDMTRKREDNERGAALVEMALVAPILLMLFFGIWTVARAYNIQNTLDHAAREAARYAAVQTPWDTGTTPSAVRAIADTELAAAGIAVASVSTGCIELIAESAAGCNISGTNQVASAPVDEVIVNLQYPNYQLSFVFFTHTVDLSAQAISRYEG